MPTTEVNRVWLDLTDEERLALMHTANCAASDSYDPRYNQHLSVIERDASFDRWRGIAQVLCPSGRSDLIVRLPQWRVTRKMSGTSQIELPATVIAGPHRPPDTA